MQLQNFSVNDGEGIRTTVFMAGCPLRCAWCANPEGQTLNNALTHYEDTEDILKVIRRQEIFYRRSGGGVTFSGGEPTAQLEFLKELTDCLYDEGFSLAMETCGLFDMEEVKPVLEKMDMVFIDLKHICPQKHKEYTGIDNVRILENIKKLYLLQIPMVVRIPAVIGVNCEEEQMRGTFTFLSEYASGVDIELLPYHRYGEEKYRELGMHLPKETFGIPTEEEMEKWREWARSYGLRPISYR